MATTPNGTAYTVTAFTSSFGEPAWRAIPDAKVSSPVPVLVFCHGNPGSTISSADTQFQLSGYATVRNWLMDNGWGWVEGRGAGANWGNQAGRLAYEAMFSDVKAIWNVTYNAVIGRSMGALVGSWLASQSTLISPKCAGFISLSGTANLSDRYSSASTSDKTNMNAAYSVTNETEWRTAVASYDPMLVPLSTWDGRNAIMQWDTSDTTVPYANNGQAWDNKYGPRLAIRRTFSTNGGDHNTTPNDTSQQTATLQFLTDVKPVVSAQLASALYYTFPDLTLHKVIAAGR